MNWFIDTLLRKGWVTKKGFEELSEQEQRQCILDGLLLQQKITHTHLNRLSSLCERLGAEFDSYADMEKSILFLEGRIKMFLLKEEV